jgi:chromosome segregation ATPase
MELYLQIILAIFAILMVGYFYNKKDDKEHWSDGKVENKVNKNKNDIKINKNNITGIQSELGVIGTDITGVQSELLSTTNKLNDYIDFYKHNKNKINKNKKDISTYNADLDAIVKDLESKIELINNKINEVELKRSENAAIFSMMDGFINNLSAGESK